MAIHANTNAAIRMWIEAGVMSVEHGLYIEEDTAKLMAKKGVWFSKQPLMNDEDAFQFESPISTAKYVDLVDHLETAIKNAKKYKVRTAFGTELLFDPLLGKE